MNNINYQPIKFLYQSGLFLAAVLFSLFLCDWILLFLNFPSETPKLISHPAHYEEVRHNIEFQYLFKTNDRGLRYRDLASETVSNSRKVFVAGDSFTEGTGVDEGKRFTDLLEDHFKSSPSVLFINGGLAGTGPLEYGRLFLNVGLKYSPDALLICLYVNDVANTPERLAQDPFDLSSSRRGIRKFAHYLWPRIYTLLDTFRLQQEYRRKTTTSDFISTISQRAKEQNIPQKLITAWKESLPHELVEAVNHGQFNGSILSYGLTYPRYWSDSIDIESDLAKKKWENMALLLSKILAQAEQGGIETGIVLIPTPFMYDPRAHSKKSPWIITGTEIHDKWLSEDTEIQKRVRLWANERQIPYLDLVPIFRKAIQSDTNLNYELDGHLNNLGHQVVAKAIASWLSNEQVFTFIKNESLTNR